VGLRTALAPVGFEVVGEAADAAALVEAVEQHGPNACVLAADLPGGGLDATRRIAERRPDTAVVVLGTAADDLSAAIAAGASGYLPRSSAPERLPEALNAALDGYVSLPLGLLASAVGGAADGSGPTVVLPGAAPVRLTRRERQVLNGLVQEKSTATIATELGISQVTVRRYAAEILRKAGVRDRAALRALWQQHDGNQPA
jgi:two-component system nitrate/nitrite response regulator NarL